MQSGPIRVDEVLGGSIDIESAVRDVPTTYTVKGMFFSRFVTLLGRSFESVRASLLAPPRLNRYLPFHDYPQSDYMRVCVAMAGKRFQDFPLRESVRRVARDDLSTFAESMIGKVVLAVAGDARSTLLRLPDAYARVTNGGPVIVRELDARTVCVEFQRFHGLPEYQLGQLEGVVLHYGSQPCVTWRSVGADQLLVDVQHAE